MEKYLITDISKDYYESINFYNESDERIFLNDVEFYECKFSNIRFYGAILKSCRFENCSFENCDFSLADFSESNFLDSEFKGCKFTGMDWRKALKPFTIKFDESKINDSIFFGLDLRGVEFNNSEVRHCDFEKTNLQKVSFQECDLLNSKFVNANLTEADFRYAINYSIDPTLNKVKKAKFSQPEVISLLDGFNITIE